MMGARSIGRKAMIFSLGATAMYGHALYPLYVALKSRGHPAEEPEDPDAWPSMSVVVSAYREATVIKNKIDELSATGYPGPLEIIVVADDSATARAARRPGVTVLSAGVRLGKCEAVNRGVATANHDIVVLSDANAHLAPGSLRAAARHFRNPAVGAVAGEKRVDDPAGVQGFYWRFESWLKQCESAIGQTIGVVGEMLAFRRNAFRALPPDVAVDDAWLALDITEAGLRVVYEPSAYSVETASPTYSEEWERRTRVVAGNLDMLWRRREALLPGALPVTPQLWGHRLVRSSFGPIAHVMLIGVSVPAARRSWVARLFLAGNVAGAGSLATMIHGGDPPAPVRLAAQVFFLQAVALGGIRRFLRGERPVAWPKPDRAGSFPSHPAIAVEQGAAAAPRTVREQRGPRSRGMIDSRRCAPVRRHCDRFSRSALGVRLSWPGTPRKGS
ncbi:glycosyltransferase family 2 protein [Frankia sp. CiP3]|uniref:glycosyltransferase family 2 protein n=1 Tax=Frankia sp. CiP3 TaxID=2880971 RepID=UPI001EF3DD1F|nr:glycosyltransferase family 2 protein [Frankia sp. CiP3]